MLQVNVPARRSSLKRFKTYIHGEGLRLKTQDDVLDVGFHATRIVVAATVEQARVNALNLVRTELDKRGIETRPNTVLECTRVFEANGFRACFWKPKGFTFYEI
jgi:hypothetical protein